MNTDRKTRTAEFARLFDLFEHLASRGAPSTPASSEDAPAVPKDIAPVIRNLAALLGTRNPAESAPASSSLVLGRPRRNTVAAPPSTAPLNTTATFPLGAQFPFTFKLMIHKLYDLEEWADKIRAVVQASQDRFKPLAEAATSTSTTPAAEAAPKKSVTRARSQTVVGARGHPAIRSPKPDEAQARAVKKRCVGRRKSVSGPMASPGAAEGGWVYDAAVSSVEREERPRYVGTRQRRQSLAKLEGARVAFGEIDENKTMGGRKGELAQMKRRAITFADDGAQEARRTKKRSLWN
ncbi:hypothetical protein PLICRDRAFT_250992 [Plicaturopsis crispa FD-325 SS-3]|nr:hypothetical protein PLICRDRAFT_250992 [Plicaturopsis crispa FD-325 SS-3]